MTIPWVTFTAGHIGRSYELGRTDCLALILDAAEKQGAILPDTFEGITRETYPEFWRTNRKKAKAALLRFIATLGNQIDPKKAFTGDLLIMRLRRNRKQYVGIHAGQNTVMASYINKGIQTMGLEMFEIEAAYRISKRGVSNG